MDNLKKKYTSTNVDYKNLTKLIYQELSWLPLYIKQDGKVIRNADNNAEKYITDSLKIMKLKTKDLKNKKVFNIGTGRESRFFASHGADVTHIDIGPESVNELKNWTKKHKFKVNTNQIDIADADKTVLTMEKYITDILTENEVTTLAETPAPANLFTIDESPRLTEEENKRFLRIVAQLLYLATRTRPDIM